MKVLIIFGSPHKSGNTKRLLNGFMSGLGNDVQTEIINIFELNPLPCDDCGYCKVTDGCRKKDLESFFIALRDADIIIFATPIYNMGFPAPLKALFDRFQRYYNARFERGVKYAFPSARKGVLLVTSGCDDRAGYDIIKRQCINAFNVLNIKLFADILITNTDETPVGNLDVCKAQYLAGELSKEYSKNDNGS